MATDPIRVDGLNEFVRNLKTLDKDLPKMVRLAFNEAADIVVDDARPRVPSRSGRARKSVKARSTRTFARVVGGGNRAPYYPWLDFGGSVGKGRTGGSGRARGSGGSVHRPFKPDGRYIYWSYFQNRDRFAEVMVDALVNVADSAGVGVE